MVFMRAASIQVPIKGFSMALILCIDDCENGLSLRKLRLEKQGHKVLSALTDEQGFKEFQANPVELVVSDHCLKEKTGGEATRAMKSLKPDIPFITVSGRLEPPADLRDIDAYLTKGGPPQDLLEIIADSLRSKDPVCCSIGQSLRERYRVAATAWARPDNSPSDAAGFEAEHDQALLHFVKHKQHCPDCLSE
jgi:CheY-like chemotaxis protein